MVAEISSKLSLKSRGYGVRIRIGTFLTLFKSYMDGISDSWLSARKKTWEAKSN